MIYARMAITCSVACVGDHVTLSHSLVSGASKHVQKLKNQVKLADVSQSVLNLNMMWHVYGMKQFPNLEGQTGVGLCKPFVLENI